MCRKYELITFDLDGTLLDTSPGIFNSVRYAEEQLDLAPISDEKLKEEISREVHSLLGDNYYCVITVDRG